MNKSKLIRILIAVVAVIGFTTVGLVAQEEDKQSEGKEKVKSEEEQTETDSKPEDDSSEQEYRGLPEEFSPCMHPPEEDPGVSDDPILGRVEDTNSDE